MALSPFGPEAVYYDDGTLARNVSISVVSRGTTTPVSLFADDAGTTPIIQPASTDQYGNLYFCVETGDYDLLYQGARIPITVETGPTGAPGPQGDPGILVSVTPPADPYDNQLWLRIAP